MRESHLWRFRVRGEYAVAKRTPRFSTEFYTCTHTPSAKALSWTSCNLMFLQDSKLSKCRQKRHYKKAVPVLFCKMLSSQSYCQKHEKCMLCLLLACLARALVLALLGWHLWRVGSPPLFGSLYSGGGVCVFCLWEMHLALFQARATHSGAGKDIGGQLSRTWIWQLCQSQALDSRKLDLSCLDLSHLQRKASFPHGSAAAAVWTQVRIAQ